METINTLEIDIETYSDVDLGKCGQYRYVESPAFEILLFAYSINDGPVSVIDLASGEELPDYLKEAIESEDVIKIAHNAAFERVCLSRFLGYPTGKYLDPESWRCSMIMAAYNGLPLSLKGVGEALNLDAKKMTEGKELIRYFCIPCKPTKVNGGRTRNLPSDAPDKWATFKAYNKRDVEAEQGIIRRLSKYPVPDFVWTEYHQSERINDRGIRVDIGFVQGCLNIDEQSKEHMTDRMKEITGLSNPNSVLQLTKWLSENGVETPGLDKKSVQNLIKTTTGEVQEALILRSRLSKTSIKKYQAMMGSVCSDDRARGMFQFYGANRSGRYSGKIIQLQNLSKNHMEDLISPRLLIRHKDYDTLDMLYDDIPDVLSQLVRTSFIPADGYKYIVADFSAIEARVLSWLAGEKWRMDVFANGGDIYCATASKMFHCNVVKGGENGELRQKGKQAELACIAEGSLVLTDTGLVPIEKVTTQMKVWDGENWVEHDGVIYKGEREVITYEGLTATPDHLVWVEGKQEPVQLGIAASCRAHLVKTGDGRNPIRMGENHQSRETMEQELEPLLCSDRVSGLWFNPMAVVRQSSKWKIKGLSGLFSAKTDSVMARQKANSSKTTLRESKRFRVSKLWSKGHQILFSFCDGCGSIFNRAIRASRQIIRAGQNRYERKLCARESSICNSRRESFESKKNGSIQIRSAILALQSKCGDSQTFQWRDQRRNNNGCGKSSRTEKKKLATYIRKARLYDIRNAGPHHRFTVSDCLVHNCGYGGGVGAMIAMGALDMGMQEEELKPLVDAWRAASPHIVNLWWEVDRAVKTCIKKGTTESVNGLKFYMKSGVLFIRLPSGRTLSYIKPQIGENKFGGESVTYMFTDTVNKWSRIESYGPKFIENIVQGISRDILCYAMSNLKDYRICAHVHDECIIECPQDETVEHICQIMSQTPPWASGLVLNADGYECMFYMKQ